VLLYVLSNATLPGKRYGPVYGSFVMRLLMLNRLNEFDSHLPGRYDPGHFLWDISSVVEI